MTELSNPALLRPPAMAPMSQHASPPAPPQPKPPRTIRPLRLLLGLVVVAAAALALARQYLALVTDHAVIAAVSIPLRTPIGGEVTAIALQPGEQVVPGAPIARIENTLADRRLLREARLEQAQALQEAAALAEQVAAFDRLAASLAERAEAYRQESARYVAAGAAEAERMQAAAEARARRAGLDAVRAMELARGGFAPVAQRDRAEAERDSAIYEAAAFGARGDAFRAQGGALDRGLFVASGFGGSSYAEQRLDEIALRRAELVRLRAAQLGVAERAARRAEEESARHEAERLAQLTAQAPWHAWRVLVKPGQRVTPEEILAEMVDCGSISVLAAVPQTMVPDIAAGQRAWLRLDGESADRAGTVRGWLPEGMTQEGGRLAVVPTRPRGRSQVAEIALDAPPDGAACPVGRSGRVLFERTRGILGGW